MTAPAILACRQCESLTDQLAALRRELTEKDTRLHVLADQETRARTDVYWLQRDLTAALDREHRQAKSGSSVYVSALEKEIDRARHPFAASTGGLCCVRPGCGEVPSATVHRVAAVVRAEALKEAEWAPATSTPSVTGVVW